MVVDVPKTFVGARVRQLRSERGFSQAALAQMLDISPSYLNQIEHDVRPLTVAVLLRITEVFGLDETNRYQSQDLFVSRLTGRADNGMLTADLSPTGTLPTFAAELSEHALQHRAELTRQIWGLEG